METGESFSTLYARRLSKPTFGMTLKPESTQHPRA